MTSTGQDPAELVGPPPTGHLLRRLDRGTAFVAVLALAVRVQNVARNKTHAKLYGDAFDYFMQGTNLANGHGFTQTLATFRINTDLPSDAVVPTAAHPPGFTVFLAFLHKIGLTTPLQQRYALCVIGTCTVILITLTARRLLGRRGGLVAGTIAALYPNLWISDGLLMSESLFLVGFALGLYGIYGYLADRRPGRMAIASVGFTIAMSTRPEQILCFPLIVLPAVLARRAQPMASRIRHLALAALFPLSVLVPWTVFNATRFAKPVFFTTGSGQTLLQGNCRDTYSGKLLGSISYHCMLNHLPPAPRPGVIPDESVQDAHYRKLAVEYMKYHRWELPKVIAAREGRIWALYRPGQQNVADSLIERRGPMVLMQWSQRVWWLLAGLSLFGMWRFRREGIALYPLVTEIGITAFVTAFTFGNTRYRAGVDLCAVLLATAALLNLWSRLQAARRRRSPRPEPEAARSPQPGSESVPPTATTPTRTAPR